jgi:aldose 1-epimerase
MFTIENKMEDGFAIIILKDNYSNTSAEIIPSCGAVLHKFTVIHNNEPLNIIDNYHNANDFSENVTAKGFKSCKLSPFACRVKNATYKFGETTYTLDKFLLNENALHGLLYNVAFEVIIQHADAEKASVILKYKYRGNEKGYPFHYDCLIKYQLQKDNVLHITTEIINKGDGLMPIQDGWHPYFTFGGKIDDLQLEFQSKGKIEMNGEIIPTGNILLYDNFNSLQKIDQTVFDDCFVLNFAECQPLCVLRDANKKIQLEIHPSKHYPYLQIYSPPHRNSIAIENLSAAPDTFNNAIGLITLAPQQRIEFETTYKITLLP